MRYIRKSGLASNGQARGDITGESSREEALLGTSSTVWRKSARSAGNGACVEIAQFPQCQVGVRDSKNTTGPVLVFESAAFQIFLRRAKNSDFDI
jgi:Domain of unknown function (DUF397)